MNERVIPSSMQKTYDRFHFAPAVKVGDLLLCSGQIGAGDDPAEQFRSAFGMVREVLQAAGADLDDIVEMTTFHVDMGEHLGTFMGVKDEFISEPYPAWTAIGCTELAMPNGLVEIRVQAHVG